MKKFICAILTLITFFAMSFSALAGSVPYDLAEYDDAVIYFGQVKKVFYGEQQAAVKPVKVIKGDVPINDELKLVKIGYQPLIAGNTYIFASFAAPSETYIFFPDSYDTETLHLSERSAFYDEVEERINSGRYKDTDNLRIDRINEFLVTGTGKQLTDILGIRNDGTGTVSTKDNKITEKGFYNNFNEIVIYPADQKTTVDKRLEIMTIYTENGNELTLTSDGKIEIVNHEKLKREAYIISTENRDKLISVLYNEKLPFIHLGTVQTTAGAVLIISAVVGIIIVRRLKKKKAK